MYRCTKRDAINLSNYGLTAERKNNPLERIRGRSGGTTSAVAPHEQVEVYRLNQRWTHHETTD